MVRHRFWLARVAGMVAVPNDDLIMALFAAFATFTAFGAAIAGFVAGNQLPSVQHIVQLMPDPGEGYANTNAQLFGTGNPPSPPVATNAGSAGRGDRAGFQRRQPGGGRGVAHPDG